jgi:hypothetical protein
MRGLAGDPVDLDVALVDESLDPCARQLGQP